MNRIKRMFSLLALCALCGFARSSDAQTVTTLGVSNIVMSSATAWCNVATGAYYIVDVQVAWGTTLGTNAGQFQNCPYVYNNLSGTNQYFHGLTNYLLSSLSPGQLYYMKWFIDDSNGGNHTSTVSTFTTLAAVLPPTLSVTNLREQVVAPVSTVSYFEGTQLTLTNCVAYLGTNTASGVQSLLGVTVESRIGDLFSSTAYTGTIQNATSGLWWVTLTVPSGHATTYLQTKLTDSAGGMYIYPLKTIKTQQPLQ